MINKYKILYELYNNKISKLPIEYIIKNKTFYKNEVNAYFPSLIIRNETILIIYILNKINSKYFINKILDIGSGAGTTYKPINFKKKNTKYTSVDNLYINSKVIKKNNIFYSNWSYFFFHFKKQNVIISNPPYINAKDINYFKLFFESKNNLLSYQNGFKNLFEIIKYSYEITYKNGIILLEHGYSQEKLVRKILKFCGYNNICTYKDIQKLSRLTYAEK